MMTVGPMSNVKDAELLENYSFGKPFVKFEFYCRLMAFSFAHIPILENK